MENKPDSLSIKLDDYNALPEEVKTEVRNTLRVFASVVVSFENGIYSVSTGTCIKAAYAPDHKVFGIVHATDIYDTHERDINYIEEFLEYPPGYMGSRCYLMLREMRKLHKEGFTLKVRLDSGNLVFVTPKEVFEGFPQDAKDEIMDILILDDVVNIRYENGKYNISFGGFMTWAMTSSDFRMYGVMYATDVYTKEERLKRRKEVYPQL